MSAYIWMAPGLALVFLVVVLALLGTRNKRFSRESQKLKKQISTFKAKIESAKNEEKAAARFEAPTLEKAQTDRRALRKQQAKAKAERQRRLVKRLESLSKTERG